MPEALRTTVFERPIWYSVWSDPNSRRIIVEANGVFFYGDFVIFIDGHGAVVSTFAKPYRVDRYPQDEED